MVSCRHKSRSSVASLSSASFIPDSVFFLHPPLPCRHTVSFSSSLAACQHHILFHTVCSHHMAKEQHLLFCCDKSPLVPPISIRIDSFVVFSVQETLSLFLHIHISASIFFSIALVFIHVSQP